MIYFKALVRRAYPIFQRTNISFMKKPQWFLNVKSIATHEHENLHLKQVPSYLFCNNPEVAEIITKDMIVYEDFLSEVEEQKILEELEPCMRRMKYEYNHWDDAIHGYRERERELFKWNQENQLILKRVLETAFPKDSTLPLPHIHILDLAKTGFIKPHVDSVKFCGNIIAGLSLLSACVMRLVHKENNSHWADVLLHRRSLYIMKDCARYQFTHEVLSEEKSLFKDCKINRDRRISVICRNESSGEISE